MQIEASNSNGTYMKDVQFVITDFTDWEYSTSITFPGSEQSKDVDRISLFMLNLIHLFQDFPMISLHPLLVMI